MQFDPVRHYERQICRQLNANFGAVLERFATAETDHFFNQQIEADRLTLRWRFVNQRADAPEYVGGAVAVENDMPQALLDFVDIWWLCTEPAQRGIGMGHRGGDRLIDFVGNRCGQLAHGCHTIGVGQFRLHLTITTLAFAHLLFSQLAFADIQHKGQALLLTRFEGGQTDNHRQPTAVLADVLLFEWLGPAGVDRRCQCNIAVSAHRRRGHVTPMDIARKQLITGVTDHAQERVVGLDDFPFHAPDDDADDVGVDQPTDLRFSLGEVAVQARVVQRDRCLRRHQAQHGETRRAEHPGGQVVFQIQRPGDPRLIHQCQAKD